jgi:hypothetical protein
VRVDFVWLPQSIRLQKNWRLKKIRWGVYVSVLYFLKEKVNPDLLNAVYIAYAKAMFEAQGLEGMLRLLLFEEHFEQSSHDEIEGFARITGFYFDKRDLRRLVESLKSKIRPLPKAFRKNLEHALKIRNLLAHNHFIRTLRKFLHEESLREVVLELLIIRRSLEEVNNQLDQLYEARPRPKARIAQKPVYEEILELLKLKQDSDDPV